MPRPEDYAMQDGCWNCIHVVRKFDYERPWLYCGFGEPAGMRDIDENHGMEFGNLLLDMEENRRVYPPGKCQEYKKDEKESS